MLLQLKQDLRSFANPKKAELLQRFFKTGKGEYGEGDKFLGIVVPQQRKIADRYKTLDFREVQLLLKSKFHEERLTGLFILTAQYQRADNLAKKRIFNFYLKNINYINNWDLVDLTAPKIVGDYLFKKDKKIIYKLIKSNNLWQRRIGVLATFYFINQSQYEDTLNVVRLLLKDKHDLIHKAAGWMLREIGKRDQKTEEDFLKKYFKIMPRTMLRYAIERLEDKKKKQYLTKR